MKNFIIVIVIILVLAIIAGGFLYARLGNEVNDSKSQITDLKTTISLLQGGSNNSTPKTPTSTTTITMGDLFSLLQPVIVRIEVTTAGFQGSGSGIIIRGDGYVITNAHVIESTTSIKVTLDSGQQFSANVTSSDSNLDLAILKLADSPSNLPTAVLGSTSDITIGGVVIAAGYPLGPALPGPASFTQGIISATRTLDGQKYIQSDVDINPGNSGGALVNRTNGKVIGITSSGLVPRGQDIEGINLAIPIDVIQTYIQANLK